MNNENINSLMNNLMSELSELDTHERIEALNKIKLMLHKISPLKNEPVDCVLWVKNETVQANGYNPNAVNSPEFELLRLSIEADGYTQPIVTMAEDENNRIVIDGFHRNLVGKNSEVIRNRIQGYLPVVTINEERTSLEDRMSATIRHNRARGVHSVIKMSEIVGHLVKRNWSYEKIGKNLGMEPDEVLRLAQITGLQEMFQDKDFSEAWEAEQFPENDFKIE